MTIEEKARELREFVFKIVIIGDAAVGKTSLINQFVEGSFQEDYKPTLGANIVRKDVNLDNARVRLIMWDLAGQEKYRVVRSMYFQGCQGALLVYDVTRYNTLESINNKWLKDYKKHVKKKCAYILIGNKTDLKDQIAVPTERGKELATKIKASDFIETSARLGENIEEAFSLLVNQILSNHGVNI
ncbi:MAG: GTP-binding protein [Promethearchaeota archaeon Loki_b32]|nr:MAG: GTP-binding protein [Candidatus Lokiarchaeota archaeon Loki_b32]